MDAHLKRLADAGLAVDAAVEAITEAAFSTAREHLDLAETQLAELRAAWPQMTAAQRAIVGPAAKDVADRLAATARQIPRRVSLSEGAPELDPDEDVEPGAAPILTDHRGDTPA